MKERSVELDILKVIALFCIMLAHVNPNKIIFQVRNFDVPLMIMISVWLSISSLDKINFNYWKYIKQRVRRLVAPTWIFLTIYFIISLLIGKILSLSTILRTYLLIDGIGYVWIIRIYIYIALLTPIIYKLYKKSNKFLWYFSLLFVYLIYTKLILLTTNLNSILKLFSNIILLDIIGYSIIVAIAIIINQVNEKKLIIIDIIFGVVFFLLAINNNFQSTQNFKYPLRLYYLSYAFFIGIFLYIIVRKLKNANKIKQNKLINFISENSMWIYLWHILYLDIVNKLFTNIKLGYLISLIVLIILSSLTVYIQNNMITFIKIKINYSYKKNSKINYDNEVLIKES